MKRVLICPWERTEVGQLTRLGDLPTLPLLGQTLLEYWLSHLAMAGTKEVYILSRGEAESVLSITGQGERWGISVQVVPESRELTAAQAYIKYGDAFKVPTQRHFTVV